MADVMLYRAGNIPAATAIAIADAKVVSPRNAGPYNRLKVKCGTSPTANTTLRLTVEGVDRGTITIPANTTVWPVTAAITAFSSIENDEWDMDVTVGGGSGSDAMLLVCVT